MVWAHNVGKAHYIGVAGGGVGDGGGCGGLWLAVATAAVSVIVRALKQELRVNPESHTGVVDARPLDPDRPG